MRDLLLDLRRAGLLVWVACKYGLAPSLGGRWRAADSPAGSSTRGVRLRMALEELGLTYLKLGQYLAMRHDVVPRDVSHELRKLFERITPVSFAQIRTVLESELGGPIARFYREIVPEPIAAASVAQVHAGRLLDGRRVAVKIQRPNVRETFYADVRTFRRLASLVDATGLFGTVSVREMVDEFALWTERELDFVLEGTTADRLRRNAMPFEYVPLVYWHLTTPRVLTLELIDGLSLAEISRLLDVGGERELRARLPNLDLPLVMHRFAAASLRQVFDLGFFHGDPHPGNALVRDDNVVVFVDFGIFGELTPYERRYLRKHIEATANGNVAESVRTYMKQVRPTPETDLREFRRAAVQIYRRWYEVSRRGEASTVAQRHLGQYTGEMLELVRRYRLRMDMNTLLFWRALEALDSTALRFPGSIDLLEEMRTFFTPTLTDMVDDVVRTALDPERATALAGIARDGPGHLTRTLESMVEQRSAWVLGPEESGAAFRANNRRAGLMSVGLVGVSLLVLGLSAPFDVTVRAATLGLASLLAL